MTLHPPFPRVLTIAGSDSGGGAGIQADLKTFAALGAYGASAITAITAQNTYGVRAVQALAPEMIAAQCDAVLDDMRIDAVKIGMLADVAAIEAVAAVLRRRRLLFVVLDPVLVATSGDGLALENTVAAMCAELLPLADVLTPNLSELAALSGQAPAADENEMLAQGQVLLNKGAAAVLLKGGHWADSDEAADWLLSSDAPAQRFSRPRIHSHHTHGTGCTLSSAIAALRPRHTDLAAAVAEAKDYVHGAIAAGQHWQLGGGHGPLAHFWRFYGD